MKTPMENFNLDQPTPGKTTDNTSDHTALDMQVSPICQKDGKKVAYVTFTDAARNCEGEIPDCIISKNHGFSPEEIRQLESYMKAELPRLKRMASGVNIMRAFMGQTDPKEKS